jgi:hypothetical protein
MNGLNTINANAVFTDTLEVNTLTIDTQGTAPTRPSGDNSTNIATTAYVDNATTGSFVTINTAQTITGQKTFSNANTYITGNLVTDSIRSSSATTPINIGQNIQSGAINLGTTFIGPTMQIPLNWGLSSNSGQLNFQGGSFTFASTGVWTQRCGPTFGTSISDTQSTGIMTIATRADRSGAININTGGTSTAPINISSGTTNNAPITIGSTASTTQTCAMNGITTFSKIPSCAVAPTSANHLCNKTYVDGVGGGISLSGNNIFTGFNQFRQETGVFDGAGLSVSLDVYNPALTITTAGGGTTGQSNSGFTMFPQRLVVPAGNKSRTAYISVPIDICSSSGTAYTGNMTLNFLSVTTNTLRNGASYSGSTTGKAYLTNYTAFSKTWTGFASQVPTAKCYLGDVLIAIPLIVDNVTTDNYDVGIILTGSGAPPGAGIVFVTSWNTGISFTATNTQPSGVVFTGVNPLYLGPAVIVSTNTIVSTDNLDIATSTNDLTLTADGSLELNANNGFWTAQSVMSENFYFRARLTPNIVLQNIRGVDLLNIQGSTSLINFQTQSNVPLTIDSGTGITTINAGSVTINPLTTFTNGLTSSASTTINAQTTINHNLLIQQNSYTQPMSNTSQLGYTNSETTFTDPMSNTLTARSDFTLPSKGVWLIICGYEWGTNSANTVEAKEIILSTTSGTGGTTPVAYGLEYYEEINDGAGASGLRQIGTITGVVSVTTATTIYVNARSQISSGTNTELRTNVSWTRIG